MKKMLKKLSSVLLAVAMLVTMMPAVAGASGGLSYEKNQVLYLSSKDKYASTWGSIYVSGLSAKQKIAKSSVKTSNSSVVALESLNHSIYNSQSESFIKGMKRYKNSGKSANISFNARKSGTAKISFKKFFWCQIGKPLVGKYGYLYFSVRYSSIMVSPLISFISGAPSFLAMPIRACTLG